MSTELPTENTAAPGFARRLGCLLYEGLVAFAVFLAAVLAPQMLLAAANVTLPNRLALAHFILTMLVYFSWFWINGGQTLAMRTWHIRVVDANSGAGLRPAQAILRYTAAWFSLGLCGIGVLWGLLDRDRQFLHDRIAGTRLVFDKPEANQ